MRSPYLKIIGLTVFSLIAATGCVAERPTTDGHGLAESDLGHEDDHLHEELYEPHNPGPSAEAAAVADAWLTAFTSGSTDTDAWVSTLEPHCFSSYCELLAHTDPEQIPTDVPIGAATVVTNDRADTVIATAPADGGTWTVALLTTADGHWKVYSCTWEAT